MRRLAVCGVALAIGAACAPAPPAEPAAPSMAVTDSLKGPYEIAKGYITKAAEQFPEDKYGFQPTPEVRTFGQLIGHIADAHYLFCSVAGGEQGPGVEVEKTATTKADLQKALAESFAFCDRAFAGLNDETGAAAAVIAPINNMATTKLGALAFNTAHDMEHYGNIVTYMRINKMVPPSSQGGM